jgi:hypothetical protein
LAVGYDSAKWFYEIHGERAGVSGYFTLPFDYLLDSNLVMISGSWNDRASLTRHAADVRLRFGGMVA